MAGICPACIDSILLVDAVFHTRSIGIIRTAGSCSARLSEKTATPIQPRKSPEHSGLSRFFGPVLFFMFRSLAKGIVYIGTQ
jgi:hypothetical protein